MADEDPGWLVAAAPGSVPGGVGARSSNDSSGLIWAITRSYRLTRADAADVSQTTWLRLAEHIDKIENADRVGAWLATATTRECLQNIRAKARTVAIEDMTWFEADRDDDPTEAEVLRAESEREEARTGPACSGRPSGGCRLAAGS